MSGGVTVTDDKMAADYTQVLGRPVNAGEALSEPPCIPEVGLREYEKAGQPCPRVILSTANRDAWELVQLGLVEHCRPLMQPLAEAILDDCEAEEAASVLRRTAAALRTTSVIHALYGKPEVKP